ncbi:MAG: hypothetical protein QF412_02985 [Planctomycetota bacterium]|nr:hypothetical protein [Planctomycetota bacterium]
MKNIIIALSLATSALAQDAASTLDRLINKSDTIARVKVIRSSLDTNSLRRVTFLVQMVIKGDPAERIELVERNGRGCGQALNGLIPGIGLLAFLADGSLTAGASRSLVRLEPGLEEQVLALTRTSDPTGRIRLLTNGLSSASTRVRRDSALALPLQPRLASAGATDRAKMVAELRDRLDNRSDVAPSMLMAVSRLKLEEALDVIVPRYLNGKDRPMQGMILATIPTLGAAAAVQRVTSHLPSDHNGQDRAVRLLRRLPTVEARTPLLTILQESTSSSISIKAAHALIESGMGIELLSRHTSENVITTSLEQDEALPVFRSIQPQR